MSYILSGIVLSFAGYLAVIDSSNWPWFFAFGMFMFFASVGRENVRPQKSVLARWNENRERYK